MTSDQDLASYDDWDEIEYVYNLIDGTLRKDQVQFGGTSKFSNMSATAACYVVIERLSSNFINHFGRQNYCIPHISKERLVVFVLTRFLYKMTTCGYLVVIQ